MVFHLIYQDRIESIPDLKRFSRCDQISFFFFLFFFLQTNRKCVVRRGKEKELEENETFMFLNHGMIRNDSH